MLLEADDFPQGFMGESRWQDTENALKIFVYKRGRRVRLGEGSGSVSNWLGLTGRADDGLTNVQRQNIKRSKDPAWLEKHRKYGREYQRKRRANMSATEKEAYKAYKREYMRKYMSTYRKSVTA